jgi:hypothetical protein
MNAIVDQVFYNIRAAGLIPGVGLRAEIVGANANGDLYSQPPGVDDEAVYVTTLQQLADLDAKLTYAYQRWGCRIFYVDSNICSAQNTDGVYEALGQQHNPHYTPAWVYAQLRLRHPDCLICPEEWYVGPFAYSGNGLSINDAAYQYSHAVCRYTSLGNTWMSPLLLSAAQAHSKNQSVNASEHDTVPSAFTLICTSIGSPGGVTFDGGGNVTGFNAVYQGSIDSSITPSGVIAALQNRQCILLIGNAWDGGSNDLKLALWLQQQAHVNGL